MQTWISLIAAAGIGGVLVEIVRSFTLRSKEKRNEEHEAWRERDREARVRRILEEYAHLLRRILFRLGLKEGDNDGDIPRWPDYGGNSQSK